MEIQGLIVVALLVLVGLLAFRSASKDARDRDQRQRMLDEAMEKRERED